MRLIFTILYLFLSLFLFGQSIQFKAKDSLQGKFDQFSVDNFGRIYITQKDVIMVFSKELDTLFTSSLKTIRPTSIESSKSFRTLLFDQDRSVIQFLDNTLTDIHGEIDLVNLDIQQPILVCESFGGNAIWILDAGNLRLIKINEKLEKIVITENLTSIFDGTDLPIQMKEANDFLHVLIPGKGVVQFDVFGTYVSMYHCKAEAIDAMGNYLFVKTADTFEIIPLDGLLEPEYVYDIPKDVKNFSFARTSVYLHKDDGIHIGNYVRL